MTGVQTCALPICFPVTIGRGGHITLRGNKNLWTLIHLKYARHIFAGDGESGGQSRSFGKDGEDKLIEVPCGTVLYDIHCEKGSKVLLEKREAKGLWGGLYVFPQFDSLEALKRSVSGKNLQLTQLIAFRHTFSHFHLDIYPVLAELDVQKNDKAVPLAVAEPGGNYRPQVSSSEDYWYDLTQPSIVGLATPIKRILDELTLTMRI